MEKEKYIISFSDSDGISNLDTYPKMSADDLKRQFDQKSDKLKEAHNALVDELSLVDAEVTKKADKQTRGKGFAGGENAAAVTGGAIGLNAKAATGGAVGLNSYSNNGGAIGGNAVAGRGFSGGENAKVSADGGSYTDAIQLGTGTNNKEKTLQVYDRTVVDCDADEESPEDKWYLVDVGKLKDLRTETKENVVAAINEIVLSVGDIDAALDGILALQESIIGGETE